LYAEIQHIMITTQSTQIEMLAQTAFPKILTPEALMFLEELHKKFNPGRLELLSLRADTQNKFDAGQKPSFPKETIHIRESEWRAAPLPHDLLDRRVEITGPVDRKMVINALNSGAKTFMADFEDSCSPTWTNLMEGQQNLYDAIRRNISLVNGSKYYTLNDTVATLIVRPRGLHLNEKHLQLRNSELSGSLVDFGLFFFHNFDALLKNNTAPYFYLPKLEHYLEARWWNEVFDFAQNYVQIPKGTIKATVLIETITASFQLDEIIYELRNHMAGLNCGRWDYIFSYIKKQHNHSGFTVPDRDQITMTSPFMDAYTSKVVQVCHKRGVAAIGGMAAQIPIKNDEEANATAFTKVKTDKEREVKKGHDGTWVAHPGLVALAMDIFNEFMPHANQIDKSVEGEITEEDLLKLPVGSITEQGVRKNINVGILYIESWLMGVGAAALYHLMEDAATAEISRTQLWLWLKRKEVLENGVTCTRSLIETWIEEELEKIREYVGTERFEQGKFPLATKLFMEMICSETLDEFLTLKAYEHLD
jgi:malate synthase